MKSLTLEYPQQLAALQAQARSAFDRGADQVVIDLSRLSSLETNDVRSLITLLRRTRRPGTDVALRVTQPAVMHSLKTMALDRVFPIDEAA